MTNTELHQRAIKTYGTLRYVKDLARDSGVSRSTIHKLKKLPPNQKFPKKHADKLNATLDQ